jgi:hypothetical protein
MAKTVISLFVSFLICLNAYAVPFGQDYLGGAKFQKAILQNHDFSQGVGLFATTFGDSLPLAQKLANKGVPFLRIQLAWQDNHTFTEKQFPAIAKEAKRFCPLASKTKLYLSGACEHNLDFKLASKLAEMVLAACPQATYVNTPWKGAVLPKYINETHNKGGPKSAKSSYSSDGSPSEDIDIEGQKKKGFTEFFMFWSPRYNGRWEDNDPTPRPQRKGFADAKMIKSMLALAGDKGKTSLPKNWIYKSHSENHGKGDPRAEKPVVIAPVKVKSIKVGNVDCNYYGTFEGGRHRYYCPKWGYEIGTSPVAIGKYGFVNASFRDGLYR